MFRIPLEPVPNDGGNPVLEDFGTGRPGAGTSITMGLLFISFFGSITRSRVEKSPVGV